MADTNIWLFVGAGLVFFGGVFIYVLFMVFLPEWVGITGKVALEAERSHQEGAQVENDDLTTRWQEPAYKKSKPSQN